MVDVFASHMPIPEFYTKETGKPSHIESCKNKSFLGMETVEYIRWLEMHTYNQLRIMETAALNPDIKLPMTLKDWRDLALLKMKLKNIDRLRMLSNKINLAELNEMKKQEESNEKME